MYPEDKCGRCKRFIPLGQYGQWGREIAYPVRSTDHRETRFVEVCAKCEAGFSALAQAYMANVPPEDLLDLCAVCHEMHEGVEPIALAIGHGVRPTMTQCCGPCRARVYDTMREVGLS